MCHFLLLTELLLFFHRSQYVLLSFTFAFLMGLLRVCLFQTLASLPDQDSYYDMVDSLEDQGIEALAQRHLSRKGSDLDFVEQLSIYEVSKLVIQQTLSIPI